MNDKSRVVTDRQTDRQTETERQRDRETDTERETDRQRETDGQTDRDRQTERQTDSTRTHKYSNSLAYICEQGGYKQAHESVHQLEGRIISTRQQACAFNLHQTDHYFFNTDLVPCFVL